MREPGQAAREHWKLPLKDGASELERLEMSLAGFIRTGVLGGLTVGQHKPEIRRLLGEPEDLGRGLGKSAIESYAQRRLQLSFNRGRLILIAVYSRHRHVDPSNRIQLVWDLPSEEMLTDQAPLLGWLESAGIPFRLVSGSNRSGSSPAGDWSTWVVDGGATLTFTAGRLDSI